MNIQYTLVVSLFMTSYALAQTPADADRVKRHGRSANFFGRPTGIPRNRGRQRAPASPGEETETQPISAGFVILDGRCIPPPYTVAWRDGSLFINDVVVPLNRRQRWELRRRGAHPSFDGAPWRSVLYVERRLRAGSLLLGVAGQDADWLPDYEAVKVFRVLMEDGAKDSKIEALVKTPTPWMDSAQWAVVVDGFEPGPDLAGRLAELKEALARRSAATVVDEPQSGRIAYTMTMASMILSVIAFGALLSYQPKRRLSWRGVDASPAACQLVVRLVVLLVVLNLFDLACTLLMGRVDGFLELNPLAAGLLAEHQSQLPPSRSRLSQRQHACSWRCAVTALPRLARGGHAPSTQSSPCVGPRSIRSLSPDARARRSSGVGTRRCAVRGGKAACVWKRKRRNVT